MASSAPQTRQRYQIAKKIDAGGMAEIYLGTAESIEGIRRPVAIKRILPNLVKNENFIAMFLDEAKLSMLLTHANIVQVFDVGKSGNTFFLVMEFVEGYNLRRVFQKAVEVGYRIPLELVVFMTMEANKGLAYAHEKHDQAGKHLHVVHRDLSPPNILVSKSGEVKITDFGLAKAMTQVTITDPGVVKGKFSYLSPEATEGHHVDHRADIFATGIVMWELLANRRLFLGKSDLDTVELVKQANVPPLSKFNSEVTPEFERILARALARDPSKRYTTCHEFNEALTNYLFSKGLKVSQRDLSGMLQRLFAGASMETPEERIATLIQDEILSLAMLGYTGSGDIDGSRPIDASELTANGGKGIIDFSEFWANTGLPQATPSARTGSPGAAETAASADLARMLEGDSVSGDVSEVFVPAEGGSNKGLMIGAIVLVVAAVAAAIFFLTQ